MPTNSPSPIPPRRISIRLPREVYLGVHNTFHVTICTADRHPWFAFHQCLADRLGVTIDDLAASRGTTMHAWCVMPDHVHLVLADADIVEYVRLLKGRTVVRARRIDPARRLWQRSFYDHALRSGESVVESARYVLENPVRAGIVRRVDAYRWSGSATWQNWRTWWSGAGGGRGDA